MGYESWLQEGKEQAPSSGFDAWQEDNVSMGYSPPQRDYSPEEIDMAYESYVKDVTPLVRRGRKIVDRDTFARHGGASSWIQSGATRVPRNHTENIKESYTRGEEGFLLDQSYYDATLIGDNDKADKIYRQWKKSRARETLDPIGPDAGFVAKAAYGASRLMSGMVEGTKQALPSMAAGATLAAVGGQLGPQALAPEEIVTVPLGIAAGFKLGTTHAWYKQGTGAMRLEMKDKDISDNIANTVSAIAGVPYALIEQMQINNLIPGVREGANKVISLSMRKIAATVAKKYGATLGQEVLEEVAQEGIGVIAEDLAGFFDGQGIDISVEELKERGLRLWNTGKESAHAMMLLPIPGAAVDFHAGIKGKQLAGKFKDAGYDVKQSESMAQKVDEGVPVILAHRLVVNETISDSHNKDGGSSISQQTGRPITKGFPVGIGLKETVDGAKVTPEQITEFKIQHQDALAQPGRQVGTWFNEEDGKTYLDVVQIAKTQEEAMELGREHGEIVVYNLETGETIPLEVAPDAKVDPAAEKKPSAQINPDEEMLSLANKYGLSIDQVQQKLDNAEKRFRKLSDQKVTTQQEEQELHFLAMHRKDAKAILDRDSGPVEDKAYSKKQIMDRVHNLSDLLGYDIVKRRDLQKRLTGKESLKGMVPAQREQVMMYLEREAKEAGMNIEGIDTTPVGELMTKMRERKQKPALRNRDRRTMTRLKKVIHNIKRGVSYYFLNSSRVRRIARALDNYEEDGAFTRFIFRPVRAADAKAAVNFTAVMESTIDAFNNMGIDAADMITEVKDIGITDKLTTAQRIGVYALSKNEKTMNHLLSEFSEEEISKIVASVEAEPDSMMVAQEVGAYFEHGWYELESIAKAVGVKGLVKEENYITAFVADKDGLDTPNFIEGLMESFGDPKHVPGEERLIKRKPGAKRQLELDIFTVHARAAKSIERFKAMAPVAAKVGSILNHRGFKNNLNNVTYGHGASLFSKWLQDSIRGKAAYDNSRFAPMLRWLRTSSMNYVLGFKFLTAGKQGVSLLGGMSVDPKMVPLVLANAAKTAHPKIFAKMYAETTAKSDMMRTRDWDRDLRTTYNKAQIKKMYEGKKLSSLSMRMATAVDRHTSTAVWYSAYQLAQSQDMNEEQSIQFADGVVQDTQPMASAADLPTYFRGSELEKTLTIFQNQVNQNGNMLWYDILGEAKAKKIDLKQAAYRTMVSQILPAYMLGMITRGRPSTDPKEIAKDILSFTVSPFVFVGRLVYNIAAGDWGPSGRIETTPFTETERLVSAVKKGDPRNIAKYGARTIGAWSGGKVPLQAVTTAEGAWDLATGETKDWRELVWSKYALKSKTAKQPKVSY